MARAPRATGAASGSIPGGTNSPAEPAPAPEAEIASEGVAFPTAGRVVHVRITGEEGEDFDLDWRPAIVITSEVGEHSEVAFAQVFLRPDDRPFSPESRLWVDGGSTFIRLKDSNYGDSVGNWRWPQRN